MDARVEAESVDDDDLESTGLGGVEKDLVESQEEQALQAAEEGNSTTQKGQDLDSSNGDVLDQAPAVASSPASSAPPPGDAESAENAPDTNKIADFESPRNPEVSTLALLLWCRVLLSAERCI